MDRFLNNLKKLKLELEYLKKAMAPHWSRFLRERDSHSYVNLFVEAQRI